MRKILDGLVVKKAEKGKFRFSGKESEQSDDYSIKVTCKDSTEQIVPSRFAQDSAGQTLATK